MLRCALTFHWGAIGHMAGLQQTKGEADDTAVGRGALVALIRALARAAAAKAFVEADRPIDSPGTSRLTAPTARSTPAQRDDDLRATPQRDDAASTIAPDGSARR